jgi:hypothetical protein
VQCRLDSAEGADEALTQAALLKVYKDLPDGAFAAWAATGAAGAAALAESPGARDVLASILEDRRKVRRRAGSRRRRAAPRRALCTHSRRRPPGV